MKDNDDIATNVVGLTKTDLARAYFPSCMNDNTARQNLLRWLKRNPVLMEEVEKAGYRNC